MTDDFNTTEKNKEEAGNFESLLSSTTTAKRTAPKKKLGIRDRLMEAVASRVDDLIETRRSLLITAAELQADLVESGALERFDLQSSSCALAALGDVMGGHGFKVPQIRRSWCRLYVLPCVKMTEAERGELSALSTKELTSKVHDMHLERFGPSSAILSEQPGGGPFCPAASQLIETLRTKLPEVINLVGDVFISPSDIHQLDVTHQILGGGSGNDPSVGGRNGDISDSEDEIRDALASLKPALPFIWTDYGVHYFLPGLVMNAECAENFLIMPKSASFRMALATKRVLVAPPGEMPRDTTVLFREGFWGDVLMFGGVRNEWFASSETLDDGEFDAAISKAFWLERRLHRAGFMGWRIEPSAIESEYWDLEADRLEERAQRLIAEIGHTGSSASGTGVKG